MVVNEDAGASTSAERGNGHYSKLMVVGEGMDGGCIGCGGESSDDD